MKKKFGFFAFAALLAGAALMFGLSACSNGSDDNAAQLELATTGTGSNSGGTSAPTTSTTSSTDTGGGQTQDTTPATYTITFNANDGSQTPATATQTFTAGKAQALKTIAELGFSKNGFNFAGWGTSSDASESSYADGVSYTASANATLYALWSAIPVYSVNTPVNEHGTVTASPATATAGTEITLSNSPNAGYQFVSYSVTDADGTDVTVTDGKFMMPAKNITVTATFNAIHYNINVGTAENGNVTANATTTTIGTIVTLTASPESGYELATLSVTDSDGTSVTVSGTGESRTFEMPAKNVTVTATFNAINYNINIGNFANGSVTANPATATIGTSVTLTASPSAGYLLETLDVIDEGGASVTVSGTGNTRTFTMPAKNVTVAATFSLPYKKTGTKTINGMDYDLVTFGSWPQTIKASSVEVTEQSESKTVGAFTYYKGSDGEWYVKLKENAYNNCKYSDGTAVKESSANSYKWFKVEPINWRILTANYNGTGRKFLLAESVLIGKRYDISENRYINSEIRTWLNESFFNTAFTLNEQSHIADTEVNNNERSTVPNDYDTLTNTLKTEWNNGVNVCVCDPTMDKVFLLSEQEATNREYGFVEYYARGAGNTRIHMTTDYAKASGAFQNVLENNMGGWWWLRSPYWYYANGYALSIYYNGDANSYHNVSANEGGVVPAICLKN